MAEIALNVPFDSSEIISIACSEFLSRLRGLSPLQGEKQYVAFSLDFAVTIRLRRSGEAINEGRETLAWGKVLGKEDVDSPDFGVAGVEGVEVATETSHFESKDPNEERMEREMPLTVESSDGRGGRVRRKVRVKG